MSRSEREVTVRVPSGEPLNTSPRYNRLIWGCFQHLANHGRTKSLAPSATTGAVPSGQEITSQTQPSSPMKIDSAIGESCVDNSHSNHSNTADTSPGMGELLDFDVCKGKDGTWHLAWGYPTSFTARGRVQNDDGDDDDDGDGDDDDDVTLAFETLEITVEPRSESMVSAAT
ncbi:hypothetical protein BCR39DRAFT_557372 [Naematelia encephala]|uniref:Uncharacterized protein n=1 Tax=Naematelia encephala TaxID=71784 RepID=A0A1Y2BD97_9TREE|nr:hypothetical protein BCR39DRAFT_557372 [Naematelia encephala]